MNQENKPKKFSNKKLLFWLAVILIAYALPRIIEEKYFSGSGEEPSSGSDQSKVKETEEGDASRTSLSPQEEAIARAIKNGAVNDLHNLASLALQYRLRTTSLGGGQGSFVDFKLPLKTKANENATYDAQVLSPDIIRLVAVSAGNRHDMISVEVDRAGNLSGWKFTGAFRYLE